MKHASSREMFGYWNECRRHRNAPERDDIDPGAMRKVLGDSLVLAVDPDHGHPFRLAGTRLCALFCRELKGEPFAGLWDAASRPLIRDLVGIVTKEAVGVVAGATGRSAGDPPIQLELLLLPLYHRGRLDARLLGILAPLTVPYWLGARPLETIALGGFRHVGAGTEGTRPARISPALRAVAGKFVVYEGGAATTLPASVETVSEG